VFGASGFIGRWLVKELLGQGVPTTAAVRSPASARRLMTWLEDHSAAAHLLHTVAVDFSVAGLGIDLASIPQVYEVYNVAGAYVFGMTAEDARAANVDTSRRVVEFSATLPALVRLVHLSGYRVGGQDPATVPWSAQRRTADYARLGAYEASKVESDAVVQATARQLGVPLTVANPSTVIGDSVTGESDQLLGLATTVLDLIAGKLRAIPGGPSTFVPVVTVDYLARVMALLPTLKETRGMSYWILDDVTPALPDLLRLVGEHHQIKVPRLRIPVGLVKVLPVALTHADPETLSFLSADRYPTGPAIDLARAHGLRHPDVVTSLQRWSEYLAHSAAAPSTPPGRAEEPPRKARAAGSARLQLRRRA
jgi:dihydroflavonol-4-reductase